MSSKRRDARSAILDAAWRLLERRGAGVSLEEVAHAAGVSRQAVYLHFQNRSELLVAVTDHAKEKTGLEPLERAIDAAATPSDLFVALARVMAKFHRETAGASLAVEALCREDAEFAASWSARPSGRLATARRIARRLAAAGALAVRPVDRAADVVWALTGPSLYDQLAVRRGWTARAYERELAALLTTSVVRPESADRPFAVARNANRSTKGSNHGTHRRRPSNSRRPPSRLEPS